MIAALAFGPPRADAGGRSLRGALFAPRSTLALSAACLVANGVREQLSRLLATDVEVELIEPAIPAEEQRRVLTHDATILRVRGRACDGFVVLRRADARRLVALAFGESDSGERETFSEIERATLERIAHALVPLCNALCGTLGPVTRETSERAAGDLATYFEVRTSGAVRIAVGFGLSRDPSETVCDRVTLDDLADVELRGAVEFGSGWLGVTGFSHLAPGATIVLDTPLSAPGRLRFSHVTFARGTCGASNGRSAISLDGSPVRSNA